MLCYYISMPLLEQLSLLKIHFFFFLKFTKEPLKIQPCLLDTILFSSYVHVDFIKAGSWLYFYDEVSY